MEASNFITPAKPETQQENPNETTAAHKLAEPSEHSRIVPEESRVLPDAPVPRQSAEQDRVLDELENKIQEIGSELREIYYENFRVDRKDIKRRTELQTRRNQLRQELLNISHQHKLILLQKEQATQEEIERERREAEARFQEELRRIREPQPPVEASPAKEEQPPAPAESEEVHENKEQEPATQQANVGTLDEGLRESRRRLRILQIEEELALSRLRRSRRVQLDAELSALRLYSSYPYYSSLYPYYYSYYPLI